MISRRDFLAAGGALAALLGSSAYGGWSRLMAQQRLSLISLSFESGQSF